MVEDLLSSILQSTGRFRLQTEKLYRNANRLHNLPLECLGKEGAAATLDFCKE